jgi:RimJ/RimL family protein N-acetyltransferase
MHAMEPIELRGLELERVAFRTDIRNERSQRAIERLGAVKEGIHRHEMRRRDGSWRDSVPLRVRGRGPSHRVEADVEGVVD